MVRPPTPRRTAPLATATRTTVLDEAGVERLLRPRDDVVVEAPAGDGSFTAVTGAFSRYRRTVAASPRPDGRFDATVTVDFRVAVPGWGVVFVPLLRRALTRPPGARPPWWAPPDRLDERAGTVLGWLLTASLVAGYLGTLLTQTMTFAADEFGAGEAAQGTTLAVVALADRRGRRRVLVGSAAGAVVLAACGALAPSLAVLGATQVAARGCSIALAILISIVAAEEMPAGSRAYAISVLAMAAALGAGVCLWALPLADTGEQGWRALYVLPLLSLPLVRKIATGLPESRRFAAPHAAAPVSGHGRRFWLLGAAAFLLSLFGTPASGFLNEFLREDRGYTAAGITAFSILTNTPGGIGIVVGGKLADLRGRRLVGAVATFVGTGATALMFLGSGWAMWAWSILGAVVGAAAVPALGVYGPELFPTSLRGRANGVIAGLGVAGGVLGLVLAGALADPLGGIGHAIAVLAVAPVVLAVLVLTAFPETAHRELEELNPEDRLPDGPPAPPSPAPPRSGPAPRPR
jgi:MFS family permease